MLRTSLSIAAAVVFGLNSVAAHAGALAPSREHHFGWTQSGYQLFEITTDPQRLARAKRFINEGLTGGQLKPVVAKTFPLDEIVEAHRFMESNQQIGKIVVTV